MNLVNDPLYSRYDASQYDERAPTYSGKIKIERFNVMATVADNSCNISQEESNKVASKVEVFPIRTENHDIEDCTYELQQTMEERGNLI